MLLRHHLNPIFAILGLGGALACWFSILLFLLFYYPPLLIYMIRKKIKLFNSAYFFYLKNPELLKVEDVKDHVCAKFSRICAKFIILNAKQEKQAHFYDFGAIWQNPLNVYIFYGILSKFLCAKCLVNNFACAK